MKCKKCGKEGTRYLVQRNIKIKKKKKRSQLHKQDKGSTKYDKIQPRTDFRVKCPKCNWVGEI